MRPLLLILLLPAFGCAPDFSGDDSSAEDGSDGADGTDGSDGTSDGSDGTSTGTLPDCEAADGFATDLDGLAISGDTLSATLAYSGGCEEHVFTLCWPEPAFMESEPVQAALEIHHGGTPDPCEAYPTEVVDFDLTPLKEAWQDSYGATSGTIILHVRTRGGADSVEYSF